MLPTAVVSRYGTSASWPLKLTADKLPLPLSVSMALSAAGVPVV